MAGWGKKFLGSIFPRDETEVTMIGKGLSVLGTLHFGGGVVRLDGHLQGKVIGRGTVVVGEEGSLQGEMEVKVLILGGRVEGRVKAGYTRITPTGRLWGKVQTSQLVIERGGIFEGEGESRAIARDLPGDE
jgi:cytoskeletal protein CcmA (bactofilin family)